MSHPFCGSELACSPKFPKLGWESWNGKAIYIKTTIDQSVTHRVECGAAIERCNQQVGARFYMTPDQGDVSLTFFERGESEWPFTVWREVDGNKVWGVALNYTSSGELLGINPGKIARSDIYVNRDIPGKTYPEWINVFAHEMAHSFGLADHPKDDINSVMSYQSQGRWLLGPSFEDVRGIANIYGLSDLTVRPESLDGIENIIAIWHYDRYGKRFWDLRPQGWQRWAFWFTKFASNVRSGASANTLAGLVPYETYLVRAKAEGLLGYGRFALGVAPGEPLRWVYM